MVSKEGICGLVVEHSASEGITVIYFLEQFLQQYEPMQSRLVRQNTLEMSSMEFPSGLRTKPLQWNITPEIERQMKQSAKLADK